MELLKKYNCWNKKLGKAEQLFQELMKVPRAESKLRVFAFTITFTHKVEKLKFKLNALNNFTKEVRGSTKLRLILKTLVSLGNPFNRGNTPSKIARSIKLKDIDPSTPERIAFMHHIRTILGQKKPELLEFTEDLAHLGAASKIQLRDVAQDMVHFIRNLERVKVELSAATSEGVVSSGFLKVLTSFSEMAGAETNLVRTFYSVVGRTVDSLTKYLLDDPAKYPFEKVIGVFVAITNILGREKSGKGVI